MASSQHRQAYTQAPINIALIKYWGKLNEALHIPCNSSLSVTLAASQLRTTTRVCLDPDASEDQFFLNGSKVTPIPSKVIQCINMLRLHRFSMESGVVDGEKRSEHAVIIHSENTVPTAAGLASSASGFAALVVALAKVYDIPAGDNIVRWARMCSGSACCD